MIQKRCICCIVPPACLHVSLDEPGTSHNVLEYEHWYNGSSYGVSMLMNALVKVYM